MLRFYFGEASKNAAKIRTKKHTSSILTFFFGKTVLKFVYCRQVSILTIKNASKCRIVAKQDATWNESQIKTPAAI
jgi:hypothetical protein